MKKPNASLAIFRSGRHQAVDGRVLEFSAAAIEQMATNYSPEHDPAPFVVGHPKLDAPAYGWAGRLEARDGVLYAEPHQVEPQFAELVNAGRLKKVSATVYLPDSPGNPKPGEYYLRNVGFLGAAAPAVKGLPVAQFAEGDGAVEFAESFAFSLITDTFSRLRDWLIEREGAERADQIIPQWQLRSIDEAARQPDAPVAALPAFAESTHEEPTMPPELPAEFAERERQLTDKETGLAERERALLEREATARRAEAAEFAEQLVHSGQLLPRQAAKVVELLLTLGAAPVQFAEGDATVEKPAGELLRGLLGELPRQLDYREKSADTGTQGAAAFAAPPGVVIDSQRLDLHAKARAWQAQHPGTDFITAVRAVGG